MPTSGQSAEREIESSQAPDLLADDFWSKTPILGSQLSELSRPWTSAWTSRAGS